MASSEKVPTSATAATTPTLELLKFLSMAPLDTTDRITESAWPASLRTNEDHLVWHLINNLDWLDSGDVIGFSGQGWRARLIELFTWSDISHIGIILRAGPPEASVLYLLESSGHDDGLECQFSKVAAMYGLPAAAHDHTKRRNGVRLVYLQDKLRKYINDSSPHVRAIKVCVVKSVLRRGPDPAWGRDLVTRRLIELADALCGAGYDASAIHFMKNTYATSFGSTSQLLDNAYLHEFTCTELVAVALHRTGMINGHLSIGEIQRPKDFLNGTINSSHWSGAELSDKPMRMMIINEQGI